MAHCHHYISILLAIFFIDGLSAALFNSLQVSNLFRPFIKTSLSSPPTSPLSSTSSLLSEILDVHRKVELIDVPLRPFEAGVYMAHVSNELDGSNGMLDFSEGFHSPSLTINGKASKSFVNGFQVKKILSQFPNSAQFIKEFKNGFVTFSLGKRGISSVSRNYRSIQKSWESFTSKQYLSDLLQIEKDLHRISPTLIDRIDSINLSYDEKIEAIRQILTEYVRNNLHVGYSQGMDRYAAAALKEAGDNQLKAQNLFDTAMISINYIFADGNLGSQKLVEELMNYIKFIGLDDKLEPFSGHFYRWVITGFQDAPSFIQPQLFQIILAMGVLGILTISKTLLNLHRDVLKEMDEAEINDFIKSDDALFRAFKDPAEFKTLYEAQLIDTN